MGGTEQDREVAVDEDSIIWHGLSQTRTSELPIMTSLVKPFAVTCRVWPPAKDEVSPELVDDTVTGFWTRIGLSIGCIA